MDLVNDTPFPAAWLAGKLEPPRWSATFLVKTTWTLSPGGVATPAAEPLMLTGDRHLGDDPERPLVYPSDFAFLKPRTDLLLVGTYHAPPGKAVTAGLAGFRVGGWSKRVAVIGDRHWGRWSGQSAPLPLKSLPLSYDRAYGGPGFERNPLGRGAADVEGPDGKSLRPLPNIEDPEKLIENPNKGAEPAGFGPLPGTWPQRASKAGTYGKRWQAERWPWYPEDFDFTWFNAAPADQQLPAPLRGDEELVLENLHPAHPKYACRLPGLRLRCFLEERVRASAVLREVPLAIDTLWIDADREQLVLLWRGRTPVKSRKLEELITAYFLSEPLAEAPATLEACRAKLADARARGLAEEAEEPEDAEEVEEEDAPDAAEEPEEAPPPAAASDEPAEEEPAEEPPDEPPPPGREELLSRIARKESLAGLDLAGADLGGADLSGVDLKEAMLAGASLAGALLAGADLSGASLAGADLRGAAAAGAVLKDADLAEACLRGADLSKADLSGADLSRADLANAKLRGAKAPGALFPEADLSGADLGEAQLGGADFTQARLHGTSFAGAVLASACLERAWGRRVSAEGADLTKLQAAGAVLPEGRFGNAKGAEAVWQGAQLYGADFKGASLPQAEFTGAYLSGAILDGADLREACLDEANLTRVRAQRANFLKASLQKADLTSSDFRESNFFEATCWDAAVTDGGLQGANLAMAKFGKGA